MSWNIRRLSLAIENAVLYACCTALILHGYWLLASVCFAVKLVDNLLFISNWRKHGGKVSE